ncbi:MAG TPA: YraN family protein [Solirubrobacteraceae bacterium]|jgi:putative endonuclease|nr:YraN family protein [Solirubrobacteraceae bacterium]
MPIGARTLGPRGEEFAVEHLARLGYRLLTRNHRTRWGELDLIVCDGRAIVFVEVKARCLASAGAGAGSSPPCGLPLEAVTVAKQRRVRRMARAWLAETQSRPHRHELRFDAIGVMVDRAGGLIALEHVENAF